MKRFVMISSVSLIALFGVGLSPSPSMASNFGSITLKPGEMQQVYTGAPVLNMRVCNDFSSAGAATVTIAGNTPHDLLPGRCAEDIGDRIVFESHATGDVTIFYRSLQDNQGHHMNEDD